MMTLAVPTAHFPENRRPVAFIGATGRKALYLELLVHHYGVFLILFRNLTKIRCQRANIC